jgi:hypothetical protein
MLCLVMAKSVESGLKETVNPRLPSVMISDRRKSGCRWNHTLFDSSYHRSPRLHIKHILKYPSIKENERQAQISITERLHPPMDFGRSPHRYVILFS